MNSSTMFIPRKLGTHNGNFHCDEAFGSFILKLLFPNLEIVRTRNEQLLAECDVVIDVGGVYDHGQRRYDHHQPSFDHSFSTLVPNSKCTTKLSTAGLVYLHYGHEVIREIVAYDMPDNHLDPVYNKVYETFVQEIDANNNSVSIGEGKQRYSMYTDLSNRVAGLNKTWNHVGQFDETEAFEQAMKMIGSEFVETVLYAYQTWLPARLLVIEALERRYITHSSGRVLELSTSCPWKEHYFSLEEELGDDLDPKIDFVVFEDLSNKSWIIQSMPISPESSELRKQLPHSWRNLIYDELSSISGVKDCIFCHTTGFLGSNKNREGIIKMAEKALE